MSRVKTQVPLAEAKRRALAYLKQENKRHTFVHANMVGQAIWPDSELRSQGFGGAASRILILLEKEGKVRWASDDSNWGWQLR